MNLLSPDEVEAILLSLKVATTATAAILPPALAVAWLLARRDFKGKALLAGAVHLPLVLPPVVTGYLLLLALGRQGPIGAFLEDTFGIVVAFRWTGAAIASSVMGFPLAVRAMRLSLEAIDRGFEEAAASLGAPPSAVFATVTLPLMAPGILAGAVLAFAKSLGEFGATITFVSNIPGETRTVPAAIYGHLQAPGGDAAALRLTFFAIVLSLAALVASELLARRVSARLGGGNALD